MSATQAAFQYAIQAVFYAGLGFVAAVSTFWPWWQSQLGWTIAAKSVALSLAVSPGMLVIWFGRNHFTDSPALQWVSIVCLFLVPVILTWRAAVLWHVQRTRVPPTAPGKHPTHSREGNPL